jgi:nitrite reductase/ring-hydroxylating ferredoxin subunit
MLLERVLLESDLEERRLVRVKEGGADVVCVLSGGRVYAFENSCPHTGYKLHLGKVRGCNVTCSSHLAQFDMNDGHLVSPPMEGQDIPTGTLTVYTVTTEDGWISIEVPER